MANEEDVVSETLKLRADATEFIQDVKAASEFLQTSFFNAFTKLAMNGDRSFKVIEEALRQLNPKDGVFRKLAEDTRTADMAAQNYLKTINLAREAILAMSRSQGISPAAAAQLPIITTNFNPGQINAALQQLNTTGAQVNATFSQSPGIIQTLATALGFTLANAIQTVIRLFVQAYQTSAEFAKGMFRLEVGVRALQRTGMQITFKEMREEIVKLKAEFGTFSEKELTLGAVNFGNLISGMGFTREEMFKLMRASTTLAIVNGRNMEDVQRTLALALSSGYTEGLQRLGVSINRVTIAMKAGTMGYADNYMSLTEVQRAHATMALIEEKVAKYQKDVNEYQKTYIGLIDQAKAKTTDLTTVMGGPFLTVLGGVARTWAVLVEQVLIPSITFWKQLGTAIAFTRIAFQTFLGATLAGGFKTVLKDWKQMLSDAMKEAQKMWGLDATALGDVPVENPADAMEATAEEAANETVTKIDEILQDSKDQIEDIYRNYYEDLAKLEEDYFKKIEDENRDYARRLADLQREAQRQAEERALEHARKLEDINRDTQRDIEKENRDYINDLASIDLQYEQDVEKAKRKYRQDQINKEAQFQERMRQLRENFMFDLEEAVRKGDARAARQAARKYVLDKAQAIRERNLEKKEDKQSLADELAELAREREIKRQERYIAFQERLADIARQAEIEKADEELRYAQQQEEDALRYAQEREDAARKHAQEMADIARWLVDQRKLKADALKRELEDQERATNRKLVRLAQSIQAEYQLTAQGLARLYQLLNAYYGPNGLITQMLQGAGGGTGGGGGGGYLPGGNGGGYLEDLGIAGGAYAEGGSFIATRPIRALFGESGDELVTATPLNKVGRDVGKLFGSVPAGTKVGGGVGGTLQVEVLASKDFEVRIIDKTMNQFSEVLTSSRKARNGV